MLYKKFFTQSNNKKPYININLYIKEANYNINYNKIKIISILFFKCYI